MVSSFSTAHPLAAWDFRRKQRFFTSRMKTCTGTTLLAQLSAHICCMKYLGYLWYGEWVGIWELVWVGKRGMRTFDPHF
jgi:hypothetical protein